MWQAHHAKEGIITLMDNYDKKTTSFPAWIRQRTQLKEVYTKNVPSIEMVMFYFYK